MERPSKSLGFRPVHWRSMSGSLLQAAAKHWSAAWLEANGAGTQGRSVLLSYERRRCSMFRAITARSSRLRVVRSKPNGSGKFKTSSRVEQTSFEACICSVSRQGRRSVFRVRITCLSGKATPRTERLRPTDRSHPSLSQADDRQN